MRTWTAALLVLAVAFGGISADAKSKGRASRQAPVAVVPPTPPPVLTAPPGVEPLQFALQHYAIFQTDVTSLQGRQLSSNDDLDGVLETAAAHNRDALMRGWLAYGALTAAQSPEFVKGVQETAGFYGNAAFIRGLTLDPGYAQSLKGGAQALQLALASARADGDRVYAVGATIKEMAYGLQKQKWATAVSQGQPARITRLKSLSYTASGRTLAPEYLPRLTVTAASVSPGADPTQFGGAAFWDTLRTTPQPTPIATVSAPASALRVNQDRVGVANRMTTLAALYIIGATQDPSAQVERLLSEGSTSNCLEIAQVQFHQCMSAAHFRYENAFCVGEHALKDVGACLRDASMTDGVGASTPVAATLPATVQH